MIYPKPKRVKNKQLISEIRSKGCIVCGKSPNDVHHIKSRGSGGHDYAENLAPVCRMHHIEWHQLGNKKMAEKYHQVYNFLVLTGNDCFISS